MTAAGTILLLASPFGGAGEELRFVGGTLSPDSFRQMHRAIGRLNAGFPPLFL